MNFSLFCAKEIISGQEDMKITKNAFSSLILEFFANPNSVVRH
jgi:hypothetical protein